MHIIFDLFDMKPTCFLYLSFFTAVIFMGLGCERSEVQQQDTLQYEVASFEEPNTLTELAKEEGWKLLFDGETTAGWRGINQEAFPGEGWKIEDGMLMVDATDGKESANGGDIITTEQYSDFVFDLEWKMLTKGGNSGIKYFVKEGLSNNEKHGIGPEYQILDDENHPWMLEGKMQPGDYHTLASLYEIYPAENKSPNSLGEWNHSRIVAHGKHVEHWFNGTKVLEYERDSDDFRKKVAKSKFSQFENFGEATEGHILLQDHGSKTAFRNIRIKELHHPFFVFNNGVEDDQYDTPIKQVQLLESLGYDGMEKKGIDGLAETLEALDKYGLKLYTMYLNINLDDEEQPYDRRLKEVFRMLEGRSTMPWFYITSKQYKPSSIENDAIAVPILQEIADMADEYGIKVMIYPHVGFWLHNVEDAVRVAKKVNRQNLGITFNLSHFLADKGTKANEALIPLVKKAMPYLFAISLNGADEPTEDIMQSSNLWQHFIQPLGEGNYNTYQYLNAFIERGFKGPIGLQCFNIEEEKSVHLKKSINTWKSYEKRSAQSR